MILDFGYLKQRKLHPRTLTSIQQRHAANLCPVRMLPQPGCEAQTVLLQQLTWTSVLLMFNDPTDFI